MNTPAVCNHTPNQTICPHAAGWQEATREMFTGADCTDARDSAGLAAQVVTPGHCGLLLLKMMQAERDEAALTDVNGGDF